MTQEDKQLLLVDLCARLPYGVKVETPYAGKALVLGIIERKGYKPGIRYIDVITDKQTYPIRYIKPYLRPMSSMTEEEDKEWQFYKCKIAESCDEKLPERIADLHEWIYKKKFDYRGLIPKDLAISTEEFNPYKD